MGQPASRFGLSNDKGSSEMNTQKFTTRLGRSLLGLIAACGIGIAISHPAQAQNRGASPDERNPSSESVGAQAYREAFLKKQFGRESNIVDPFSPNWPFNNQLAILNVTNHTRSEIRFVSWVVTFTHPVTGAVIRTKEITSKSRIAPGKEKTLKKTVAVPRMVRVTAADGKARPAPPKMTTALTSVTYADGTTSRTP
jgi:hypothetical protein